MISFVLVSVTPPGPPATHPRFAESRVFWLESLDRSVVIPIAGPDHRGPWRLQRPSTGLGVEPVIVEARTTPGVPGGFVHGLTQTIRRVILPLHLHTETQAEQFAARDLMFALTDPSVGMTREGSFRLVCSSLSGVRQLTLTYAEGFEGDEATTMPWFGQFPLVCDAVDPFARDREEREVTFRIGSAEPFLAALGSEHVWPRALAPSTVIGTGMRVTMPSAVPVSAVIEAGGPMDSFSITSSTGLSISSPSPIGSGEVLRIVTDPRAKSFRLDGEPAAGRIARGSVLAPFQVGENVLDVAAPGATAESWLRLSWRGGYRSLW